MGDVKRILLKDAGYIGGSSLLRQENNDNFFRLYWKYTRHRSNGLLQQGRTHPQRNIWRCWILSTQRSLHDGSQEATKADSWCSLAESMPENTLHRVLINHSILKTWRRNCQPKTAIMKNSLSRTSARAPLRTSLFKPLNTCSGLYTYRQDLVKRIMATPELQVRVSLNDHKHFHGANWDSTHI